MKGENAAAKASEENKGKKIEKDKKPKDAKAKAAAKKAAGGIEVDEEI